MNKNNEFRRWLEEMWYDHKTESHTYNGKFPDYTREDYFKKYKWWLKKEFVHKQKKEQIIHDRLTRQTHS